MSRYDDNNGRNNPPSGNYRQPGNYPPPGNYGQPGNYPPPGNYRQPGNYPPPGNYRQPGNYPPPGNYGQPGNYPPPENYGQPGNYPPPGYYGQPGNYPPPGNYGQPGNYPPPGNHGQPGNYPPRRDRDKEPDHDRKKEPKKKGSVVGTIFSTLLLIVALGVFGYSAFTLYGYYKEYKAGTDEYGNLNDKYVNIITSETENPISVESENAEKQAVLTNVEELENPTTLDTKLETALKEEAQENGEVQTLPTLKNPINFPELKAINEDIMGWIRVGALDISYPIAQGPDNDYYLHRTFERVENFAGCIFLNCDNTKFMTDQNTIVYGHNMKNGSMFGILHKMAEQENYDKNPYFWIFTPEFIYQYRIFSCSNVNKIGDPYRTRFITEDFQNFIDTSQSTSMIDNHGVEVTTADRIVTLSTCTSDDSVRFIVQGKLENVYVSK